MKKTWDSPIFSRPKVFGMVINSPIYGFWSINMMKTSYKNDINHLWRWCFPSYYHKWMVYHIHEFTMKMVYVCLCHVLGELYSLAPQQLQYSPTAQYSSLGSHHFAAKIPMARNSMPYGSMATVWEGTKKKPPNQSKLYPSPTSFQKVRLEDP
jgi:hypothetical protein